MQNKCSCTCLQPSYPHYWSGLYNLRNWYWNRLFYTVISSEENSEHLLQLLPITTFLAFFNPIAIGTHHRWIGRGSVEWEDCVKLLLRIKSQTFLILSPIFNALFTRPHVQTCERDFLMVLLSTYSIDMVCHTICNIMAPSHYTKDLNSTKKLNNLPQNAVASLQNAWFSWDCGASLTHTVT